MASIDTMTTSTELVLAFQQPGSEQIPGSTILTRLNYYDGKFLRADDLRLEQDYQRYLAELGARGCGSGLIYGFDVSTGDGDLLTIGGGLAFDGNGRVLYMPASFTVSLQSLINLSQRRLEMEPQATAGSDGFQVCVDGGTQNGTPPPAPSGGEFWKISISHISENIFTLARCARSVGLS